MTSTSRLRPPTMHHVTREGPAARLATVALAASAGLVLADAAIVVLALPDLVVALDTSVQGVAAVVAVYTAMLAVAALAAVPVIARLSARVAAVMGAVGFAAGSLGCASATDLAGMLVARAGQGGGGGLLLVAAFAVLRSRPEGRRAWRRASMAGLAAGPALGGALTQALGWEAVFAVAVPVALAAVIATTALRNDDSAGEAIRPRPEATPRRREYLALALLSAALVAVSFVVVLMLVTGWGLEPLAAAALMTILPAAALAAARMPWPSGPRMAAGAVLVAGGIAALAVVRGAPVFAIAGPLALVGFGLGLAVPALEDRLLGGHGAPDVARITAVRHAAVTLALVALAPLVAAQLDRATETARQQQVAALLDSRVPPLEKLRLLPSLTRAGQDAGPRDALRRAFDGAAGTTGDRKAVDELRRRSDASLVQAAHATVQIPLLVLAGTALAAALVVPPRLRSRRPLVLAAAAAVALVLGTAAATASWEGPQALPAPCESRKPQTGSGLDDVLQGVVLEGLARTACAAGATREELLLATASHARAEAFEREHGVDPRRAAQEALGVLLRLDPAALLGALGRAP